MKNSTLPSTASNFLLCTAPNGKVALTSSATGYAPVTELVKVTVISGELGETATTRKIRAVQMEGKLQASLKQQDSVCANIAPALMKNIFKTGELMEVRAAI